MIRGLVGSRAQIAAAGLAFAALVLVTVCSIWPSRQQAGTPSEEVQGVGGDREERSAMLRGRSVGPTRTSLPTPSQETVAEDEVVLDRSVEEELRPWRDCLELGHEDLVADCLSKRGLKGLSGSQLAYLLCSPEQGRAGVAAVMAQVVGSWQAERIVSELAAYDDACERSEDFRTCFQRAMRTAIAADPVWAKEVSAELLTLSALPSGSPAIVLLMGKLASSTDDGLYELLRVAGTGALGGSPLEIDHAANAYIHSTVGDDRIRYARSILASEVGQNTSLGMTLAASLLDRRAWEQGRPDASMFVLLELLNDSRFSRGAASQVMGSKKPPAVGDGVWLNLVERAAVVRQFSEGESDG